MPSRTRVLTGHDGQRFAFDPGSFCLELLLTGGPGKFARHEILHTPDDLARWLADSRLAAVAPLDDLRIDHSELAAIRRFRDTMLTVAQAMAHGERPAAEALDVVNEGATAFPRPRIDPATGSRAWAGPVTGAQILGAAAADAIDMLTGPHRDRIRECAASDCLLLFLDTSRPGRRRWCSMERCGNRQKVSAYRARRA
ncbi:ABATE domain-containing protein [Spongiactinospora sp. TRM90649]|uniref:CGNR zinc finger domain-containing protein n=1 Tax=Spongiactinospora sp. TRM90649 TaxID=3031114 RepID=UPI0023F73569|nr:ABATE domain-containing protein [Spongiactinospora sp. TRM90649]MDF5754285.1 CGNR zinc finger domain-containing protein [Spongiactinospora sp. TRM90649]